MSCACKHVIPDHLRRAADELYGRAELQETIGHVTELNRLLESGHRKLAAEERATKLGLAGTRQAYEFDFTLARRHAAQARAAFSTALRSDVWREAADRVDLRGQEFTDATDSLRRTWSDGLAKADGLSGADAGEMLAIFDRVAETAKGQGIEGLLAQFEEQFSEFDAILTNERDYGRQAHSPLQWWQWLIIIGILVIAIAALIVCLWWFGCSWIYAIFVGVCAGALATGGVFAGACIAVLF